MPSLTRSTLVQRIRDLIDDPSDTRWSASVKQDKIQEAQERFVIDTRCLTDVSTVNITADTSEYDLPGDVLDITRVASEGRELRRLSKFDIDFYTDQDWSDDTARYPKFYYVDLDPNNKKLRLYPTPNTSVTNGLRIEFIKIPPTLSADSSVPWDGHTLLTPYHMAIAYFAAKELLNIDPTAQNIVRINQYQRGYEKLVSDCIETWKHMEKSEPIRLRGGRYYKGV